MNQLPAMAVAAGASLAIVNLDPTHLDGQARWLIRGRAAGAFTDIRQYLGL